MYITYLHIKTGYCRIIGVRGGLMFVASVRTLAHEFTSTVHERNLLAFVHIFKVKLS